MTNPSTARAVLLLLAGAVAGALGSAGGMASLVSFPVLLSLGIPALPASVTNSVAVVACWPGSALGSRPELRGQGPWVRRWTFVVALGGVVGAGLLLSTPAHTFVRLVPLLVALGSLALLFQPQLSGWQERHFPIGRRFLLPAGLLLLSVYNGYFGAGAGVMVITLLLLLGVDQDLLRVNALKNMLVGVASAVSAVAFVLFGPVNWLAAAPLAVGLFAGSTVGPSLARRVPRNWLRVMVALGGLGLAVRLWIAPI